MRCKTRPLYEAIQRIVDKNHADPDAKPEEEENHDQDTIMKEILVPASKHDIDGVAYWLVDRFFNDSFQVLPDREARESRGQTHDELYRDGERSLSMLMAAKTLLNSPNTYSINLWSSSEAVEQRLVRQLVRLDRLPRNNPLSGLRLLSDAWRSMVKVPPLGSAPARPLCLLSARLAALGSSALPE